MNAVAHSAILRGDVDLGEDVVIEDFVRIGAEGTTVRIGAGSTIRAGSVVYGDVSLGDRVQLGHGAVVREHTDVAENSVIGTQAVVEGHVTIGARTRVQTGVVVAPWTEIQADVFVGPNAVLTNDKRMGSYVRNLRDRSEPFRGPVIRRAVRLGANCTVLPEIELGEDCVVGAGSVVTRSVAPGAVVVGVPAVPVSEVDDVERLVSRDDLTGS